MKCVRILIRGVLKGVGYLAYTYLMASSLGIRGWARYLDNDSVEVIAVGDEKTLENFIYALKHHNTMAIVNEISSEPCGEGISINQQTFEVHLD